MKEDIKEILEQFKYGNRSIDGSVDDIIDLFKEGTIGALSLKDIISIIDKESVQENSSSIDRILLQEDFKVVAEEIYNRWQLQDKDLGNTEPYQFTKSELSDFAETYHQEKMKQHDALVKMMAQDEKEGNYQDKCCDSPTIFYNVGLDDLCVRCGKNITPSPPSNL